ncbi:MAG: class D sortase [Gammaproteobacteria bacterium]|nr:class D sortase [Gammaproteobacteria bacterium]
MANYAKSLKLDLGEPEAVIAIPALDIAVPVYADRVPMALEGGTAWVDGTMAPGTSGNVAIAGHRDSFFRPLEGIPVGTRIQLTTNTGTQEFAVVSVSIVDALDTHPLDQTDSAVLTLITCHPFRYIGFAPDRYIVRAELTESNSHTSRPANSAP